MDESTGHATDSGPVRSSSKVRRATGTCGPDTRDQGIDRDDERAIEPGEVIPSPTPDAESHSQKNDIVARFDAVHISDHKETADVATHHAASDSTRITLFIKSVSANAMYRARGRGVVISAEGREFKKTMSELLARAHHGFIRGPVKLSLAFEFTTKRKRDLDNYAKPLIDSLKNVLFEDDSEIYLLTMTKRIGAAADCVRIECDPIYDDN